MQQWRTHTVISTRKRLNSGVWFVVNERQGKLESLNHFRNIMEVSNQKALQEQPHNIHKVNFLESQYNSAMSNSAQSNVEHEQPKQNSCHLTYICCLPAFTDESCRETSWQELNWGKLNQTHPAWCRGFEFKSELKQRVNPIWIHEKSIIIRDKVGWQEPEQNDLTLFLLACEVRAIM